MLASKFIERIQELIDEIGDVEVIIHSFSNFYEIANVEAQNVVKGDISKSQGYYKCQEYNNDKTLIKVF